MATSSLPINRTNIVVETTTWDIDFGGARPNMRVHLRPGVLPADYLAVLGITEHHVARYVRR